MSAGVLPEGMENFMAEVREASVLALQSMGDYDNRVIAPALIMGLVSFVAAGVDDGSFEDIQQGMDFIHNGLDALAIDFFNERDGLDNGH